MKISLYDQKIYPYETDLASSAYNAGDWYRAAQAYILLLREHNLDDQLRQEVRNVLDTIYRKHLPQVEMKSLWDDFDELGTEMIVTKAGR